LKSGGNKPDFIDDRYFSKWRPNVSLPFDYRYEILMVCHPLTIQILDRLLNGIEPYKQIIQKTNVGTIQIPELNLSFFNFSGIQMSTNCISDKNYSTFENLGSW
jgi:hypothetical protein